MQLLLQGTGAADGIPALFSPSRVSTHAREHRGKDIRTRSAALLNGHIKIDFGPDTWSQASRDGLRPCDWTDICITHSHDDHLALGELQYMLYPFNESFGAPLVIHCNEEVAREIEEYYPGWPFEIRILRSFEPAKLGDLCLTPISAYHKLDEDSLNFLFEYSGNSLLYATDTGYYREPTWDYLKGRRIQAIVLECTEGLHRTQYHGHLDLKEFLQMIDRLKETEAIAPDAIIATTHHSHFGDLTHSELEERLDPHGVLVGYDGMVLEIP